MAEAASFFTDGEAYERLMGRWSRAAGEIFLDWLALPKGLRWLDAGCGTGVFTRLVLDRCTPSAISAIDPSKDQVGYAKSRPTAGPVDYRVGDAQSLPFADEEFDVATMALVIAFLPDRKKAIAELKRVVRPGGTIATYHWDGPGNAYTQQPLIDALETMGIKRVPSGPGYEDSRIDRLRNLFLAAGLDAVTTRSIEIQLTFKNFEEYWASETSLTNPIVRPIRDMSDADVERLKALLRNRLPIDGHGRIAYGARANAVKGRVEA
jgi:ubiquinone/menaquinone biosynthesis C-methylase UbiE